MAQAQAQISIYHRRSETNTTKKRSEKLNFMYSFRPIYNYSRVCGFMPFTITYKSCGSIHGLKVETFDMLWFGVSILINVTLAFMISIDTEYLHETKNGSIILMGGDYLLQISSMIFDAVFICTDLCIRYKLVDILRKINIFDEKVSEFLKWKLVQQTMKMQWKMNFLGAGWNNWHSFRSFERVSQWLAILYGVALFHFTLSRRDINQLHIYWTPRPNICCIQFYCWPHRKWFNSSSFDIICNFTEGSVHKICFAQRNFQVMNEIIEHRTTLK